MASETSRRAALGLGLSALAVSSPAMAQPAAEAVPRPPRPPELIRGFSRQRLKAFEPALMAEPARGSFPGCVAIIARGGEVVHFEAYGHQDAARTKPMRKDTIFLQASMTKPITSVGHDAGGRRQDEAF